MGARWGKKVSSCFCSRFLNSPGPTISEPGTGYFFARLSLSRLPHYLRAWKRLQKHITLVHGDNALKNDIHRPRGTSLGYRYHFFQLFTALFLSNFSLPLYKTINNTSPQEAVFFLYFSLVSRP